MPASQRIDITLTVNPEDIARVNLLLDDIDAKTVMRRALNTTLDGIRTDATTAVYNYLNLTKTRIRKNFWIERAVTGEVSGAFKSKGKPINLASFTGTRTTTRGLSVKVLRNGTRTILRHGFLWNRITKSGDEASTAFERDYGGTRTKSSPLLPWKKMGDKYRHDLITLEGPRIEDVLAKPTVLGPLEQSGGVRFETNLERELEYVMSRHA